MAGRRKKKSAFVPRVVFGTAVAGLVVPACVVACGGDTTSTGNDAGCQGAACYAVGAVAFMGYDASPDSMLQGVAACGFCDAGDAAKDGGADAPREVGVADAAFGGG